MKMIAILFLFGLLLLVWSTNALLLQRSLHRQNPVNFNNAWEKAKMAGRRMLSLHAISILEPIIDPHIFKQTQNTASFQEVHRRTTTNIIHSRQASMSIFQFHLRKWMSQGVDEFLVPPAFAEDVKFSAASPPSKQEIALLREAFANFYGADRNPEKALDLLSQVVAVWQRQPADERAGLYRVRGDCYMAVGKPLEAITDYGTAIDLLLQPGVLDMADPVELPASFLGRARAIRSLGPSATSSQAQQAVVDYEEALTRSARVEWDTRQELLEDGARTNPYATWEYGMALRCIGNFGKAQSMHILAADFFFDIGDRARSVISRIDAGIDAASVAAMTSGTGKETAILTKNAKIMIKEAILATKSVEARDLSLLQRVIAKEGEGRMVLAVLEWTTGEKQEAESQLELICERLDQLEADAIERNKASIPLKRSNSLLRFSIDDLPGALDTSCSRLKNIEFLTDRLEWPAVLQEKAEKLFNLK